MLNVIVLFTCNGCDVVLNVVVLSTCKVVDVKQYRQGNLNTMTIRGYINSSPMLMQLVMFLESTMVYPALRVISASPFFCGVVRCSRKEAVLDLRRRLAG